MGATTDTDDPVLEETCHAFVRNHYKHTIREVVARDGEYRCRYWLPDNPSRDFLLCSIVSGCAARRAKSGDAEWFASGDYHRARENALRLSENDETAAGLLIAWAERVADVLIAANQSKVEKLRTALSDRGELGGRDVKQILSQAA